MKVSGCRHTQVALLPVKTMVLTAQEAEWPHRQCGYSGEENYLRISGSRTPFSDHAVYSPVNMPTDVLVLEKFRMSNQRHVSVNRVFLDVS
jgi:hypothetical protein